MLTNARVSIFRVGHPVYQSGQHIGNILSVHENHAGAIGLDMATVALIEGGGTKIIQIYSGQVPGIYTLGLTSTPEVNVKPRVYSLDMTPTVTSHFHVGQRLFRAEHSGRIQPLGVVVLVMPSRVTPDSWIGRTSVGLHVVSKEWRSRSIAHGRRGLKKEALVANPAPYRGEYHLDQ